MKAKIARYAHVAVISTVFLLLTVRCFFQFNYGNDYVWYHLPNALLMFGLTTFEPSSYIRLIIRTMPPLADWIQGLLVFLTGSVKAATGANSIALAVSLVGLRWLYGGEFAWRWLFTGLLAIPMVVCHLPSGYVDLFAASGVLLAFGALPLLDEPKRLRRAYAAMIVGLFMATMSRHQALPVAGLLCLSATPAILRRMGGMKRARAWAAVAAVFIVAGAWSMRNVAKFGNPTYPYKAPVIGRFFPYQLAVDEEIRPLQVPEWLLESSNPVVFLHSMFETSRWQEGAPPYWWSFDQGRREGVKNPHFRLGGWSVYTVVILIGMLAIGLRQRLFPRGQLIVLAGATLVTSMITQGHELRYFQFIPMCALFMVVTRLADYPKHARHVFQALILLSAVHVVDQGRVHLLDLRPLADHVSPDIKAVWAAYEASDKKRAICGHEYVLAIFYTGPSLSEYPVVNTTECDGDFVQAPLNR